MEVDQGHFQNFPLFYRRPNPQNLIYFDVDFFNEILPLFTQF